MEKWFWEKDTSSSFRLGSKPPPRRYVWHFLYWAPGDDIRIVEKTMILRLESCDDMSLGRALMVMCFCRKQFSDKLLGSYPPLNLIWQWKFHHLKMYLLLEMKVCQCHVKSFPGCLFFFFAEHEINKIRAAPLCCMPDLSNISTSSCCLKHWS